MFRLISSHGREYLLQAASEGELQLWSASIAAAIRETESKERVICIKAMIISFNTIFIC